MTVNQTQYGQVFSEERQAVNKTVQAFIGAYKAYSLYPEEHVFCKKSVEKLDTLLASFLEQYKELSIVIDKNCFFYKGEKIFDGPPEENNPAYLLTRDGLIIMEFVQGIVSTEIETLLKILKKHKRTTDEQEGDIVTALWQAEFQHIVYEEVDIFALEAFTFDLSSLKVSPDELPLDQKKMAEPVDVHTKSTDAVAETTEIEDELDQKQRLSQSETITNLVSIEQSLGVLEISPEERSVLESYVKEEEQKDYTSDIIDVLLIILISQKNKVHFNQVLDFLGSVFFDTLHSGDFHLAHKLCSNVITIRNKMMKIRPWTLEQVDDFISVLSEEERWAELPWVTNPQLLTGQRKQQKKYLWLVVRMLSPRMIYTLGSLIGKIDMDNISLRNEVFELIESMAKKEPAMLNSFLSGSDGNINLLLFPIVQRLAGQDAAPLTLQMTRHEEVEVRRTGLNGYLTYASPPDFGELYHLLGDEDEVIVGKIIANLLAKTEQEEAEALLIRFLKQAISEGDEHPHIFECYKALSRCGSSNSVKLLENILLGSSMKEMFSNMNAIHKKGSALALTILGTDEALGVLEKGIKSMRPDIRLACQFARDKMK